jgi:hypothetical protein
LLQPLGCLHRCSSDARPVQTPSVFYVSPLWFNVTLTGLVFSFNIISYKHAVLSYSNRYILKHFPSEFVTVPIITRFIICVFLLRTSEFFWPVLFTVWQGVWKHLSTTSFHTQHSYDRSDAAQSKLLTERPYMYWQTPQNVPICTDRHHSNAKNTCTLYKTFCFLPFTNGPCKPILIDKHKRTFIKEQHDGVLQSRAVIFPKCVFPSYTHEHHTW